MSLTLCSQVFTFDHRRFGLFVHLEAIVAGHAHFGKVEALDFDFFRDAVADQFLANEIDHKGNDAQGDEAGYDADEFGPELAETTTIKEALNRTCDGVPAIPIGAIGKEA